MRYKDRIWCGIINSKYANEKVELVGWVHRIRNLGGILFIDLRDRTGIVQLVVDQNKVKNFNELSEISNEYVIKVYGTVKQRPKDKINVKIPTGEFEVEVEEVEIISKSEILPFPINEEDYKENNIDETLRLKYRFLDLRRSRMFKNLYFRHKFIKKIRDFLDENEFLEVETPILSKPTPEGARDFLVPSRLQKGKFYALPQSPQLYKQILMVSGIDRYFQIAKCFRDEDLRADRQPEFTQLDLEMSFITPDDIFNLIEEMLKEVFNSLVGIELNTPFPKIEYKQAIDHYLSDKPDLRYPFPILKLESDKITSDIPNIDKNNMFYFIVPTKVNRKEIDGLYSQGHQFLYLIKEDNEYKGNLAKYIDKENFNFNNFNSNDEKVYTLFLISGENGKEKLNELKQALINKKVINPTKPFHLSWIVNFPLFKVVENQIVSEHHPFTNVHPEDKDLLMEVFEEFKKDKEVIKDNKFVEKVLSIRSLAYDLVFNGNEVGSGSIRIIDPNIQKIIFYLLGLRDDEVNNKFGFLLNSFKYGAPPHGGIALGLDRIISILLATNSIRDVIAFPKTQSGSCLLTSSPSEVDKEQLNELSIKITEIPLPQ